MKQIESASERLSSFPHLNVFDSGSSLDAIAGSRDGAGMFGPEPHVENGFPQSGLSYRWYEGAPCEGTPSLSRSANLAAKRVVDIVLAILALIALAPLLIGVAMAIRLGSPGPALFRQARTGRGGKSFNMYKFRSMYVDKGDASGVAQTTPDDDRVTPIGRFIRRTSIDELPQLLNVLSGDMSIVGPRPHVAGMLAGGMAYEDLVPYYGMRHAMPPGLTGWAQANGFRGPTDDARLARKRVDHDIAYIQNFSVLLDFKIIWLTVKKEFLTGSGV